MNVNGIGAGYPAAGYETRRTERNVAGRNFADAIPVVASKGEAAWIDEEGAYPESDDSFGQVSIGAFKVATMIKVSDELLNDNVFNLEAYISKEFGRRIGTKEEEAFFIGDGKGKPTGILNAAGGASDGVTTATANITFDDVMDLFYSLKAPYRKKAVWVLNDTTVKALRKLKDNNGNYIWQPSVQAGVPDMILNRPYHTSSYVPEVAAGSNNMGYDGDLELALIPESFRTDVLKEEADNNEVLVENAHSETAAFALLFEFDGDIRKIRHVLYNCSASRPKIEGKTNEESREVQTETLTIKARPLARTTGSLTASSWKGSTSPSSPKRNLKRCRR